MENYGDLRFQIKSSIKSIEKKLNDDVLNGIEDEVYHLILNSEKLFSKTNSTTDKLLLVKSYMLGGESYYAEFIKLQDRNYLSNVYSQYEKSVYICENDLKLETNATQIELLKYLLESVLQILWISSEFENYGIFKKFAKKGLKYAKILKNKTKTYNDERFYLMILILLGDYESGCNHFLKAYFYYIKTSKRLKLIYDNLLKDEIKNDLIGLYKKIINLCRKNNKPKLEIKWKNLLRKVDKSDV